MALCRSDAWKGSDKEKAIDLAWTVIAEHRDHPAAPGAMRRIKGILGSRNKEQAAKMYAKAWATMRAPRGMPRKIVKLSNWYQVGSDYSALFMRGVREGEEDPRQMEITRKLNQALR